MWKKKFFLLLTAFLSFLTFAQSYVALNVDNDLYFGTDRYYTSGIFVDYGYRQEEDSLDGFKTQHWTFGQEITTPNLRLTNDLDKIDYPYNGWLFVGFKQEVFKHAKRGYGYGFEVGTTGGSASLAKPIQNTYHKLVLGLLPLSWAATQEQALHANLMLRYYNALSIRKHFDLVFLGQLRGGTFRSSVLSRLGIQWSRFEALPFFGHRLENMQNGLAFYAGVQAEYRWHDYAVQGSLFKNNAAIDLEAVFFKHEWEAGFLYHLKRWRFAVLYNNASKDVQSQKYSRHQYLNITLTRLF